MTNGNVQELSVSELSQALKRTVEDAYSYVRVRGEVSGFKRAASGHLYMTLKDQEAVLDGVCWRGSAGRLSIQPEDGLEVIATGRITTFPGRSKYQIVIDQIEIAGEGALLKLLEERRRRLAEEGLFDEARKKRLPYLPDVIGVVTSPTGAVIRDILHRLADRFPRHVLLWPVLVQGDGAAQQVADAIAGFNRIAPGGPVPRPDLLIVARGGGSLEDLWSFNEEVVVRAAAASDIPLISAVGHETDTTLIDFASDRRAPTPTAAAEIAVPVRADLMADLSGYAQRMIQAGTRGLDNRQRYLDGLVRGLPKPRQLLEPAMLRLDDLGERLGQAASRLMDRKAELLANRVSQMRSPVELLTRADAELQGRGERLDRSVQAGFLRANRRYSDSEAAERLTRAITRRLTGWVEQTERQGKSLVALSYKGTLDRGYAIVRDDQGALVSRAIGMESGSALEIEFAGDQRVPVLVTGADAVATAAPKKPAKPKKSAKPTPSQQQDLF